MSIDTHWGGFYGSVRGFRTPGATGLQLLFEFTLNMGSALDGFRALFTLFSARHGAHVNGMDGGW